MDVELWLSGRGKHDVPKCSCCVVQNPQLQRRMCASTLLLSIPCCLSGTRWSHSGSVHSSPHWGFLTPQLNSYWTTIALEWWWRGSAGDRSHSGSRRTGASTRSSESNMGLNYIIIPLWNSWHYVQPALTNFLKSPFFGFCCIGFLMNVDSVILRSNWTSLTAGLLLTSGAGHGGPVLDQHPLSSLHHGSLLHVDWTARHRTQNSVQTTKSKEKVVMIYFVVVFLKSCGII